jgi:hypothetical protein
MEFVLSTAIIQLLSLGFVVSVIYILYLVIKKLRN